MKKAHLPLALFLVLLFFLDLPSLLAQVPSPTIALSDHQGYLDLTTIPVTYRVIGEAENTGTASAKAINITATFFDDADSVIGSMASNAFLDVLLPGRKAPFEIVWPNTTANQIKSYTLTSEFTEYIYEKPQALQIITSSTFFDEAGFLKLNGTARNLGATNATAVKIVATFHDAQGTVVDVAKDYTNPSTIMPGNTERFELEPRRKPISFSSYALTAESIEYEAFVARITIDYGATYTKSTTVTLTLQNDATFNLTQMRFSNENNTWTAWQPYGSSQPWNLLSGEGFKTVYVQFQYKNGSTSTAYYDTIILDTTSPTISIISPTNASEIRSSTVAATWSGSDTISGISSYEIKLDSSTWLDVKTDTARTFTDLTAGAHTLQINATDKAGNSKQSQVTFVVVNPQPGAGLIGGLAALATIIIIMIAVYFIKIRKH